MPVPFVAGTMIVLIGCGAGLKLNTLIGSAKRCEPNAFGIAVDRTVVVVTTGNGAKLGVDWAITAFGTLLTGVTLKLSLICLATLK